MAASTGSRRLPGSLPTELSSFVGRRQELADVTRLVASSRLVTLTGSAGAGKTRLALRVASGLRRTFVDGAWFVDLGPLGDPDLLGQTVALALGLWEESTLTPWEAVANHVATHQLLIVLDNCEHLVEPCADLSQTLLRRAPDVRLLVTSREPLRVQGETTFAVPPLSIPDEDDGTVAAAGRSESVALFLARAKEVAHGFELTDDNRDAVLRICQRLDGLPLAIELAAPLLRALTPQQLLERLTDRYRLLSHGWRTAPERQRSLRAAVDWSYELCTDQERSLWSRLSVFSGWFELDAAEEVCSGAGVQQDEVAALLAALVDKSILLGAATGGLSRYRLLESLRDYGLERLHELGEDTGWRRRHRDWYEQLARRADEQWISDAQPYFFSRLAREHANLQRVLEYCLAEPGEEPDALRILMSLWRFYWWGNGWISEGRHWLELALAAASEPSAVRAMALLLDSTLAIAQGDFEAARPRRDEGQLLARASGDVEAAAFDHYISGAARMYQGDLSGAIEILSQGLNIDASTTVRLDTLLVLGIASGVAGDQTRSQRCHQEMIHITEGTGECFHRSYAFWALALNSFQRGELAEATDLARQSLLLRSGLDDRMGTFWSLETLAWIAGAAGDLDRAATLLGASTALLQRLGSSMAAYQHLVPYHDACDQETRAALGQKAFAAAFEHGENLEDPVLYALDRRRRRAPPVIRSTATPLTDREHEVAGLVATGMSNREIAEQLVISQRTAETHVARIMAKLGIASRTQVADWLAEKRRPDP